MLVVDFDPTRPRDEGQFHVRLVDAKSGDYGNDAPRQSQLGYWCDIGHLRSGVLAAVEAAIKAHEAHDRRCQYEIRRVYTLGQEFWNVRCGGVRGHRGPHQAPEEVWTRAPAFPVSELNNKGRGDW